MNFPGQVPFRKTDRLRKTARIHGKIAPHRNHIKKTPDHFLIFCNMCNTFIDGQFRKIFLKETQDQLPQFAGSVFLPVRFMLFHNGPELTFQHPE